MTNFVSVLSIIDAFASVLLLCLLVYRRAWQRHLAFLIYGAFGAIAGPGSLWCSIAHHWHSRVHIVALVAGCVLALVVAGSFIRHFFFPLRMFPRKDPVWTFCIHLLGVVALSVTAFWFCHQVLDVSIAVQLATAFLVIAVFCMVGIATERWLMSWRHRHYWIFHGFVVYAGFTFLTAFLALIPVGFLRHTPVIECVTALAHLVAMTIWAKCFIEPDTKLFVPTEEQMEQLRQVLGQLEQFTDGLAEQLPPDRQRGDRN